MLTLPSDPESSDRKTESNCYNKNLNPQNGVLSGRNKQNCDTPSSLQQLKSFHSHYVNPSQFSRKFYTSKNCVYLPVMPYKLLYSLFIY